jgi:hypothetical protein
MSNTKKGRCAVLIVELPEGVKPQRPHELPERFLAGHVYAKNLGLGHVLGFVLTFNKHQLATGLVDRHWALAVQRGRMFWEVADEGVNRRSAAGITAAVPPSDVEGER